MTGHTRGPWKAVFSSRNGAAVRIDGPRDSSPGAVGSVVRQNGLGMPACAVGKANARLIAAAPEMLTALQELEEFLNNQADVDDGRPNEAMRHLVEVRSAIRKAGGYA